ncbi:MAG: MBL fold metallo-hydrolase [Oscillospiraceae bacterium]|nr:MBL fold metallo-hydrolase [Oscillospiraceae bacterium]
MKKSFKMLSLILAILLVLSLAACGNEEISPADESEIEEVIPEKDILEELGLNAKVKGASESTVKVNSAVYSLLDFEDTSEYENATRGLIAAPEVLELTDENGNVIWSQKAYSFLNDYEKAPDTVNPSLWENTKNNHAYGLFEVVEGIYQVRGYDMANLTVIKGETGWIVFDPLMSVECTKAAMQLINENLGEYPVKAVIISHCHVDHFGGIAGIMSAEEMADASLSIEKQLSSEKIPVIVPEGFAEHAISENVYAGKAMGRRANYQYGVLLEPGVSGTLAMGIGMGQSTGTVSYLPPTYEIKESGEVIVIDGIEFEFQLTPGTEAPAEMNTWLPDFNALWVAENCTGTLHNLYTLRGAQVRDGAAWAGYIMEAVSLYGEKAEVTFQSHNWPHWGNEVVNEYMVNTAAVYKFINDQTLTYINQGYTSDEISNMIKLPEALEKNWYTRQYYGTVAHNSKAVYQKFMGWYDANPVNLNPLEPSESAKKWVEYLGDVDEVLRMAKADFEKGEYQWVAEVTNTIVFADPENKAARYLCADALEQLGYQAESGPWRNAYLTAALELRNGNMAHTAVQAANDGSIFLGMTPEMLFDALAIRLNKEAFAEYDFTINVILPNIGEEHMLRIKNGVILVCKNTTSEEADITVTTPKNSFIYLISGNPDAFSAIAKVEGDTELFELFITNLNANGGIGNATFNIIEP